MEYTVICAMSKNGIIGNDNELPWKGLEEYKWDMKHFKYTTTNHPIIMGYNTFKSIGFKPLPNRINYVIDRNASSSLESYCLKFYKSLDDTINYIENFEDYNVSEVYIIGGAKLIEESLDKNIVNKVCLSIFDKEFHGNIKFPIEKLEKKFRVSEVEYKDNGKIVTYWKK